METVKVGRYCPYIGTLRTTPAENGTYWHGHESYILNALKDKLPPMEFVTELSESNWTISSIQSIIDGKVDFEPDFFFVYWERFQHVDYSVYVRYESIRIISAKSYDIGGQVLKGIFDEISFLMFGLAIIFISVFLALGHKEMKHLKRYFSGCWG